MVDLESSSEKLTSRDFDEVLTRIEKIFSYFPGLKHHCTDHDLRTGVKINPLGMIFEELSVSRNLKRLKDFITEIKRQFPVYLESLDSQLDLPDDNEYKKRVFKEIIAIRELVVIDQRRSALLVLAEQSRKCYIRSG